MIFTCNRFALMPHLCIECKCYIWMEGYRRDEIWRTLIDRSIKGNICKNCLIKFDIGQSRKEDKNNG